LGSDPDCYAQARQNFAAFKNVTFIRGSIPSTLNDVEISSVSYLSLDMNCAEPEVKAARFFWPKLVEIVQGRGVRYDADVVDACVALFKEGRFELT